jgi:hypothetical protein
MKLVKVLLILLAIYAALVAVFETWLGYTQPTNDGTLKITTTGDDGAQHTRVLARIPVEDTLYVAVNHWPRSWYWQALDNPEVQVEVGGASGRYRAVDVTDREEYAVVDSARPLGIGFRILTGFPPRRILRLDPVSPDDGA